MQKKLEKILKILSLILTFSAFPIIFFYRPEESLLLIIGTLVTATVFWFYPKFKIETIGAILGIIPFSYLINYFKINLAFLTEYLGISNFPIDLRFYCFLLIFVLLLLELLVNYRKIIKAPIFVPLIALSLFFSLSIFWSRYPALSFSQIIIFNVPQAFYLLIFSVSQKPRDIIKLIIFFLASALPVVFYAMFQLLTGDLFFEPDSSLARLTGTFGHPNLLGLFLLSILITAFISLGGITFPTKSKNKGFLLTLIFLFLPFFILTFSRTSWILLTIFLFFFWSNSWKYFKKLFLIFFLVLTILFIFPVTQERITGIFERSAFDSIWARENIFKLGLGKFMENPVSGYGIGTFEEIVRDAKESDEGSSFPHNDFLMVALEGGMISFFLFFILLVWNIIYRWFFRQKNNFANLSLKIKLWKEELSIDPKIFLRGAMLIWIVIIIGGMAETMFLKTTTMLIFFGLLGSFDGVFWRNKNKLSD